MLGPIGLAVASGPDPSVLTFGRKVCKGGADDGVSCNDDADCSKNKCILNVVKGKAINAVLTAFYDPDSRDWRDEADLTFKAMNVLVQFKYKGTAHVFAETYMQNSGASNAPKVGSDWGSADIIEDILKSPTFCDALLLAYPDAPLSDALNDAVGLPTTKRPYISKVKRGWNYDHSAAGDKLGTTAICKVKFGFLHEAQ